MASHADILDRPEPLAAPFWTSVIMHVVVIGGLSVGAIVKHQFVNMGSMTGGGIGVLVAPVASIPLPNHGGPENPVANDTHSQAPTPPAPKEKAKVQPKVKTPPPNAVALPSERALPKRQPPQPAAPPTNKFRDQQTYAENQIYSKEGQRMNTSAFAIQGGGTATLGDNSPFGQEFGPYAKIIRDNIGRNWNPGALNLRGSRSVVITFTIHRDGSVTNVNVKQSSGIEVMDRSAQRAVIDAQLPALPYNFPKSQADVELKFELGN